MKKVYLSFVLAAAAVIVLSTSASAGSTTTLHPSGFGPHSYAAWKAHQGLPDSKGNDDQALYFQKMTDTTTIAAGVAVIKGVAGLPLTSLTGLSWAHREDGHCGAGAPRWNIGVRDTSGNTTTIFLGCNAAAHQEKGVTSNGFGWCEDTQPSPATLPNAANLTITGLAIVFDEGTDETNPPPAGCAQQGTASGFIYLDNIDVQIDGTDHCWTGANDNSNQSTGPCPDPPAGTSIAGLPNLGLPTGLAVDPTDTELVNGLNVAQPGVPLTSWRLYPNVVY